LRLTLDESASEGSFEDRRIIAGELLVYDELFLRRANDEGNDLTQITKIMLALLDILVMGDLNTCSPEQSK
jgi:hypothetical protein